MTSNRPRSPGGHPTPLNSAPQGQLASGVVPSGTTPVRPAPRGYAAPLPPEAAPSEKLRAVSSVGSSVGDAHAGASRPTIKSLLAALLKHGASDLHLKSGRPPMFRINGKLIPAKTGDLSEDVVRDLLLGILNGRLLLDFEAKNQVDCSFQLEGLGRFRANIYMQRGTVAGVMRMIPFSIPVFDSLGLPSVLKELVVKKRGLILVTGSTGSGKSTTMASMINYINEHRNAHIVTIEDPIEFVYRDSKSSISQREIGTDAVSMQAALMAALRQDPDIVTVGEMRDHETIQTALSAAETGHLVLSTLHTNDARGTIDRIIDVFPATSRNEIRIQLAASLLAVVSQKLIPRADGEGRIAACEVMIKSPTIENLILQGELDKIPEAIATSTTYYKMQTFNQALERLVQARLITADDALAASNSPENLKMRLSGFGKDDGFRAGSKNAA